MKKRGLGRGLDILLAQNSNKNEKKVNDNDTIVQVSLELLQPGEYQPRQVFDDESLWELAESIKQQGLLQPIIVRKIKSNNAHYEIIAGERRWRASQKAGLTQVPIICRDVDNRGALAISIIENMQREDLSVIEESMGIERLIKEFSLTHAEAGDVLGKSRSAISNALRLLDLDPVVRDCLIEKKIDMGHARALLALSPLEQKKVVKEVVALELTVRETERLIKNLKEGEPSGIKNHKSMRNPNIVALEQELSGLIGSLIEIREKRGGKGELTIKYNSLDELDGIIEQIKTR